ncbi:hypothetical protein [Proteiniborus sp. MB09-C3]|uniref:hypothetical protein n=1 Tax=Proteiniborus sp. MB09-C3 TaxID=3050072 RepID=UPI0025547D6B|nr:hypothetical protein [Proteiniborus sp. MB09-C3]WIV11154.1 hypothetical protein QO263_13475 [Proteiniborus sp. MB09-C3]
MSVIGTPAAGLALIISCIIACILKIVLSKLIYENYGIKPYKYFNACIVAVFIVLKLYDLYYVTAPNYNSLLYPITSGASYGLLFGLLSKPIKNISDK